MATSSDEMNTKLSWRRFEDGNHQWDSFTDKIFNEDTSHKCPTYVHKTPPCQGSCPSGEDIRGWLAIVRGQEHGPEGVEWQEYAFQRSTDANPFPSMMGRVCPAPCQDGCNRNEVEDYVGINSVEQFIGDTALENGYKFAAGASTGKKVAVIGGGPAGMAAAYQLRRKGHAVTVYESLSDLGGMMRFGIPNYRIPREESAQVTVTYDMNILQGLDTERTYCVTLNPTVPIDPDRVIRRIDYDYESQAKYNENCWIEPGDRIAKMIRTGYFWNPDHMPH